MKSSRKHKRLNKSHQHDDIIISDDIENIESYAGVGDNNIVNINSSNTNNLYSSSYIDSNSTKLHTPQSLRNQLEFNNTISSITDLRFNSPPEYGIELKSITHPIRKKKTNSTKIKLINEESNVNQRFPPLTNNQHTLDREIVSENLSSINNQIEKLEYRKLKISMNEKKNRMKELLERGRQNWCNFKSEIDFIKSVESNNTNIIHETETMIKDEKLLNVILNEIVFCEKENMEDNIVNSPINDNDNKEIIDENTDFIEDIQFQSIIKPTHKVYTSTTLSNDMAMNVKQLLFNSTCRSWGSEWYKQNIEFHPIDSEIPFGMIQKNSGPNNIMAVIQAEFLIEALFCGDITVNWISNIKRNRNRILAKALTKIISRCRKCESNSFIVCLMDMSLKGRSMGCIKSDGITECLVCYEIWKNEELYDFILHNLNQFVELFNPGVILLVISCLMTHGLSNCISSLNKDFIRFINPVGLANDELMSLLIHGNISSHYFNDKLEIIDTQSGKSSFRLGISKRSTMGFLTIENHCDYCKEIGTYLKTPKYPIWIVKWKNNCYCVLYCHNKTLTSDWKTEIRFKLHLYSPLFKSQNVITMIIDSSQSQIEKRNVENEERNRKLKIEKTLQMQTENRLKNMSEKTLKFLFEDCSVENYVDDISDVSSLDNDFNYLDRIIRIKWPHASINLDDNKLLEVSNLFKN